MEERRRDQAPPVAVGDERPEEDPLVEEASAGRIDAEALRDRDQVDEHVRRDQQPRDDRVGPDDEALACGGAPDAAQRAG